MAIFNSYVCLPEGKWQNVPFPGSFSAMTTFPSLGCHDQGFRRFIFFGGLGQLVVIPDITLQRKHNVAASEYIYIIILYYIILHYIILLYYIKLYTVYNMYHSWYNKFLPDYPSSLDFLSYMFIMSLNTHAIFLAFSRHWTQQTELVRQRPHGKA